MYLTLCMTLVCMHDFEILNKGLFYSPILFHAIFFGGGWGGSLAETPIIFLNFVGRLHFVMEMQRVFWAEIIWFY